MFFIIVILNIINQAYDLKTKTTTQILENVYYPIIKNHVIYYQLDQDHEVYIVIHWMIKQIKN